MIDPHRAPRESWGPPSFRRLGAKSAEVAAPAVERSLSTVRRLYTSAVEAFGDAYAMHATTSVADMDAEDV